MNLGCCGPLEHASILKSAGFDFLEINVRTVLQGQMSDSSWDAQAPDPDRLPLPIEAANNLLPPELPVIGPKRDLAALQHYMDRVTRRAKRLGIQRLVFGSAQARHRPQNVSEIQAHQHLLEFTRLAGEACAQTDLVLVIEHLHAGECNTLNKLSQTRHLCDEVNLPQVAVLVDSFHYGLEKERDEAILNLGDRVRHVHVSEPVQRLQPGAHGPASLTSSGESRGPAFDFEHFFCLLHKIGYQERISVECFTWHGPIEQAAATCAQMLRQTWEQARQAEC